MKIIPSVLECLCHKSAMKNEFEWSHRWSLGVQLLQLVLSVQFCSHEFRSLNGGIEVDNSSCYSKTTYVAAASVAGGI